jgi:hypothetical protein
MKVALGTIEVPEDTRKQIGKAIKGSSYLKRDEAKAWALGVIEREIDRIVNPSKYDTPAAEDPPTAPKDADALPEPAPPAP